MPLSQEQERHYLKLAKREKWEVIENRITGPNQPRWSVAVDGRIFNLSHPYQIHLRLYKDAPFGVLGVGGETKFRHMKAVHDYLWPDHIPTWNDWEEVRFQAHCGGWQQIVLASGAGAGKSMDAAKIALIFWLSDPLQTAAVIASTTLDSLETRIWGYAAKLATTCAIRVPLVLLRSKPPKIMYPGAPSKIYGMFATAMRSGDDDKVLGTIIGRHPEGGIMIILDESTEMSPSIVKSLANLEQGTKFLQLMAIGNSNSRSDLHGALATPRAGWESVQPMRDDCWPTTHKGGICLYFNPYKSPAITEVDPEKKFLLSQFLITEEGIEEKKLTYGEHSESFYRFVLGFWRPQNIDAVIASETFLTEQEVSTTAEWAGFYPLQVVCGLDPAYSVGGRGCVLRFGVLGQTARGQIVLDMQGEELLHRIEIAVDDTRSGELQLAQSVIGLLRRYQCPLRHMAIDATGGGRALAELIKTLYELELGERSEGSFKIVSGANGTETKFKKDGSGIIVTTPTALWLTFRDFIHNKQIVGLDQATVRQITNRELKANPKTGILALETKDDYRGRMQAIDPKLAHSPDEADATILCVHAAIFRFGFSPGQMQALPARPGNFHDEKMYRYLMEARLAKGFVGSAKGFVGESNDRARRLALVPNFGSTLEDFVEKRR